MIRAIQGFGWDVPSWKARDVVQKCAVPETSLCGQTSMPWSLSMRQLTIVQSSTGRVRREDLLVIRHRDSLLCMGRKKVKVAIASVQRPITSSKGAVLNDMHPLVTRLSMDDDDDDDDDDETCSMTSNTDESFTTSASSTSTSSPCQASTGNVRFASELVTAVFTRPVTTPAEKYILFYGDVDYRAFRRAYLAERMAAQQLAKLQRRTVHFADTLVSNVHEFEWSSSDKDALYYSEQDLQRFLDEFVATLNERWS